VTRLRKRDVEVMLDAYDTDPIGALTAALRLVFDAPAEAWVELIARFPDSRRHGLLARNQTALDELFTDLNELRELPAG
jgi:hypothetical protein